MPSGSSLPQQSSTASTHSTLALPSPSRHQTNLSNENECIPLTPTTLATPPPPKRPRLSVALVKKKNQHQEERETTDAYFRYLQDKLDKEKAHWAAELDAKQQLLKAEEDAAHHAYTEAAMAGEAWISKCVACATAQASSGDTAAATGELANQLTELVKAYMKAEWKTTLELGHSPLSATAARSDGPFQVRYSCAYGDHAVY